MKLPDEKYKEIITEIMKQQNGNGISFNFLVKLHQVEDVLTVDKSPEDTLDLIREITVPIETEDLPSDEYLFYMGTGVRDMNPAVEHLKVSGDDNNTTVTILSNAAEGLIKQKSNKKAIKTIKTHLGLLEKL